MEQIFIIIFGLIALCGVSVICLRRMNNRNMPQPDYVSKQALEIEVKKAKKLIIGMSGTLDTINCDIENSSMKLKGQKKDIQVSISGSTIVGAT